MGEDRGGKGGEDRERERHDDQLKQVEVFITRHQWAVSHSLPILYHWLQVSVGLRVKG